MAALAKDPAERWQSADEFSNALEPRATRCGRRQRRGPAHGACSRRCRRRRPSPRSPTEPLAKRSASAAGPGSRSGCWRCCSRARSRSWPSAGCCRRRGRGAAASSASSCVEARAALERRGFEVSESRVQSAQPLDQVIDQDPNAGDRGRRRARPSRSRSRPGRATARAGGRGPDEKQAVQDAQPGRVGGADRRARRRTTSRPGQAIRTVPGEGEDVRRHARAAARQRGTGADPVPGRDRPFERVGQRSCATPGSRRRCTTRSPTTPEGDVISQDPAGGTQRRRGGDVTIIVSDRCRRGAGARRGRLGTGLASSQLRQAGLVAGRAQRTSPRRRTGS